jgi:hypothetical protein
MKTKKWTACGWRYKLGFIYVPKMGWCKRLPDTILRLVVNNKPT